MITNPSGVRRDWESSAMALSRRYKLRALYGPEHGVDGSRQAGVAVASGWNERFGIEEHSLYGANRRLGDETLKDIDMMLFDIQDIGSRYYTYIYTMGDAMEECAARGIPFVVLDRPNPLGGREVEGTTIRPRFNSFIGNYGLPVRHGLTVGELACRINREFGMNCDLTVLPCPGWDRGAYPADAVWLNPSPNMPSVTAARVYTGTCLFEATNISEGRGTTRPFELVGAPFVDGWRLAGLLNGLQLRGVVFRGCNFMPVAGKYAGENCGGIQVQITDADSFNGFEVGMAIFDTLRRETPEFEVTSVEGLNQRFGDDSLAEGRETLEHILLRGRKESLDFQRDTRADWLYTCT